VPTSEVTGYVFIKSRYASKVKIIRWKTIRLVLIEGKKYLVFQKLYGVCVW
jgi:hypothetical protein